MELIYYFDVKEAAEDLLMKEKTVYDWIYKQKIKKVDTEEGHKLSISKKDRDEARRKNELRNNKNAAKNILSDSENIPENSKTIRESSNNFQESSEKFTDTSKGFDEIPESQNNTSQNTPEFQLIDRNSFQSMLSTILDQQDKIEAYAKDSGKVEELKKQVEILRTRNNYFPVITLILTIVCTSLITTVFFIANKPPKIQEKIIEKPVYKTIIKTVPANISNKKHK